jgi:hypothetical protein
MMTQQWKITTEPNPARDGRSTFLTTQQCLTLDRVCEHLKENGGLHRPEYSAETEPPMSVYVWASGEWAGAPGALFSWHDADGSFWRGWVLPDGAIGRIEQDVIDRDSDDPCEIESHWESRRQVQARLRAAAGAKVRPFM